jgi:hypothetical protein
MPSSRRWRPSPRRRCEHASAGRRSAPFARSASTRRLTGRSVELHSEQDLDASPSSATTFATARRTPWGRILVKIRSRGGDC